jgi:hypothetical protein
LHAKKLSDIKPYSRCSAATAAIWWPSMPSLNLACFGDTFVQDI